MSGSVGALELGTTVQTGSVVPLADYFCFHLGGRTFQRNANSHSDKNREGGVSLDGSGAAAAPSRPCGEITAMKGNQNFTATICEI